jgi:hypothetical protein
MTGIPVFTTAAERVRMLIAGVDARVGRTSAPCTGGLFH